MKRVDLIKHLKSAGYHLARKEGHAIYEKEGSRAVQVPHHREVSKYTAEQILKIAGLK